MLATDEAAQQVGVPLQYLAFQVRMMGQAEFWGVYRFLLRLEGEVMP